MKTLLAKYFLMYMCLSAGAIMAFPLNDACVHAKFAEVKRLVLAGERVNRMDSQGFTVTLRSFF